METDTKNDLSNAFLSYTLHIVESINIINKTYDDSNRWRSRLLLNT